MRISTKDVVAEMKIRASTPLPVLRVNRAGFPHSLAQPLLPSSLLPLRILHTGQITRKIVAKSLQKWHFSHNLDFPNLLSLHGFGRPFYIFWPSYQLQTSVYVARSKKTLSQSNERSSNAPAATAADVGGNGRKQRKNRLLLPKQL